MELSKNWFYFLQTHIWYNAFNKKFKPFQALYVICKFSLFKIYLDAHIENLISSKLMTFWKMILLFKLKTIRKCFVEILSIYDIGRNKSFVTKRNLYNLCLFISST